ncbi:hypothetical protein SAMN05660330_01386 [Desulforhopalus singaporensis]|uniref:Uncharacterized protein n=1 Tax=Desulforhopalus singaporensis TaxID=91360 RepID=A0A1H0NNZ1_9BACT|nr:hypothetical protein SAMN05660330_01386 [Desulforhopalus singaporensis]
MHEIFAERDEAVLQEIMSPHKRSISQLAKEEGVSEKSPLNENCFYEKMWQQC